MRNYFFQFELLGFWYSIRADLTHSLSLEFELFTHFFLVQHFSLLEILRKMGLDIGG
jgi:hypothetical protein